MQLELTDSSLECDILELRNALGNNYKIVAISTYIFLEFLLQGGTLRVCLDITYFAETEN